MEMECKFKTTFPFMRVFKPNEKWNIVDVLCDFGRILPPTKSNHMIGPQLRSC